MFLRLPDHLSLSDTPVVLPVPYSFPCPRPPYRGTPVPSVSLWVVESDVLSLLYRSCERTLGEGMGRGQAPATYVESTGEEVLQWDREGPPSREGRVTLLGNPLTKTGYTQRGLRRVHTKGPPDRVITAATDPVPGRRKGSPDRTPASRPLVGEVGASGTGRGPGPAVGGDTDTLLRINGSFDGPLFSVRT